MAVPAYTQTTSLLLTSVTGHGAALSEAAQAVFWRGRWHEELSLCGWLQFVLQRLEGHVASLA